MKVYLIAYLDIVGNRDGCLFYCNKEAELLDYFESNDYIEEYKYKEVTEELKQMGFIYKGKINV